MRSSFERPVSTAASAIERAMDAGSGVLRLAPAWVPRLFSTPGRRLRLHPDDYYPFGPGRGGIDERWLASSVRADNGPGTGEFEGLSLVVEPDGALVPFDVAIDHLGASLIGARLWKEFARWPMFAKFFDNQQALPFHVHQSDADAALVGKRGKPEAYFYPSQMNQHLGDHPVSFLGLREGVSRDQIAEHLAAFASGGDNRITDLSLGYRTRLDTGWDVPVGVLHAPASACTYEPQGASDVLSMWESWSNNREVPDELLWKDVPRDRHGDIDALLDIIDWEGNLDPAFAASRSMRPLPIERQGYSEQRIAYRSEAFSATRMSIAPGLRVKATDAAAYGLIALQGFGSIDGLPLASTTQLRFGQLGHDEYFVSESAALNGVTFTNDHPNEPLVLLKHFGPGNPESEIR